MDANKKQQGRKHRKNKARYQDKSKIVAKPSNSDVKLEKSISKLPNNWERYEEPNESEKTNDLTNFSALAEAPLSHSGYFQFKNLLSLCLDTIPFHDRSNLDGSFLEEADVQENQDKAQEGLKQYEHFISKLANPSMEPLSQVENAVCDIVASGEHAVKPGQETDEKGRLEEWLDKFLED